MNFWTWAHEHWILAFILMYCTIEYSAKMFCRILRTINILSRGYPENLDMDADGDIVNKNDK